MLYLLLSCRADSEPSSAPPVCEPPEILWPEPETTLTSRLVSEPPVADPLERSPSFPEGLSDAEQLGLGGAVELPGEPWTLRDDLLPGYTPPETGRRSLWMVFHETDAQLADTESPNRYAAADSPSVTESAARPQELYAIHALDALIRAANGLHAKSPIDFALTTGDNIDNNQRNELYWFARVWDGLPVRPDAGADDSQLDEGCLDPIAELTPVGAAFPWYAAAGNHDVLVQGNFDHAPFETDALGSDAVGGTRDLSQPGGPLTFVTPEDPDRAVLTRSDIATILLDGPSDPGPPGHGFTEDNVRDDTVNYSAQPVGDVPIRLVTVDANPFGLGSAELSAEERDRWLLPQLAEAEALGQLVVLASHYALGELSIEGAGSLADLLLEHPSVVLVIAGHTHQHRIRSYRSEDGTAGFWQIETASTVDNPGQGRLVELVDNGDGKMSIITTVFGYPTPPGSLAERAATLMRVDWQAGWRGQDGEGSELDRNTELVLPLPASFQSGSGREGVRSHALTR